MGNITLPLLGIIELDNQHIDLYKTLMKCYDIDNYIDAKIAIDKFISDIEKHFITEEVFMESIEYPETLEHKKAHYGLTESLYGLAILGEISRLTRDVFLYRLENIIINHINKDDIKIGIYYKEKMAQL